MGYLLNSKNYCKDHCSGGEIITRKRKCHSESNSFVAAAEQDVFSLFLNTDSDKADVTSLGRPFHTFASLLTAVIMMLHDVT